MSPAQAAPTNLLSVQVTNNSGRGDKVFLYVVGVNLNTGRLGYVNAGGTFTPWPHGTTTLRIPIALSGRLYMSLGDCQRRGAS